MAAKHTHTFTGDPGYVYLLPSGPVQPSPGDTFTLTDEEAASVGEDFTPTGEAKPRKAPKPRKAAAKQVAAPADDESSTAPAVEPAAPSGADTEES